jgi:hypothetical protein
MTSKLSGVFLGETEISDAHGVHLPREAASAASVTVARQRLCGISPERSRAVRGRLRQSGKPQASSEGPQSIVALRRWPLLKNPEFWGSPADVDADEQMREQALAAMCAPLTRLPCLTG